MRIKSFQIGGHTVTIKYVKELYDTDGAKLFGICNPKTDSILIATMMDREKIAEDVIIHSIYHELAHYFMITMYEHKLNSNEKFIDNLGMHLHQFVKTKK
jgi:hypothetical protein